MLLTVSRPGGPLVVEAALGSSLRAAVGLGEDDLDRTRAFLIGGYGGAWVSPQVFAELPVSEKAARRAGATLGAGVIVPLPRDVCPLAEMADVVRYMEGQGAGQCGPCVHGLAELAESMDRLAYGGRSAPHPDRILEICTLVEGRAPAATLTASPGSCVPASACSPTRSPHISAAARALRRGLRGCSRWRARRRREDW